MYPALFITPSCLPDHPPYGGGFVCFVGGQDGLTKELVDDDALGIGRLSENDEGGRARDDPRDALVILFFEFDFGQRHLGRGTFHALQQTILVAHVDFLKQGTSVLFSGSGEKIAKI